MKGPNILVMVKEEREETYVKGIETIFNKITEEFLINLKNKFKKV